MVAERLDADAPRIIQDEREALHALANDPVCGLDLETGGLSPFRDKIAVVSLYGEQSTATAVLHIRGKMSPELRRFLSDRRKTFITHNGAAFDLIFLAVAGVDVYAPTIIDTLIAETTIKTSDRRDVRVNLKDTLARRSGVKIVKDQAQTSWMAPALTHEQIGYCADDIRHLPRLWRDIQAKAEGTSQADAIAFELRVAPLTVHMTVNGLPLSLPHLAQYQAEQKQRAEDATARLLAAYPALNVGSPKQVKELFAAAFDLDLETTAKLALTVIGDAENLEGRRDTPIAQLARDVLTVRTYKKRDGMYSDSWLAEHMQDDGRIHARFWQVGTDTGRFSCSDPNLQQVPKDGRWIFGHLDGYQIVAADYSQIEVYGAADVHGDATLRDDLATGDVYRGLASGLYNCTPAEVTPAQRQMAKTTLLAFQYGGGPGVLVRQLKLMNKHIEVETAEKYHKAFFARYRQLSAAKVRAKAQSKAGRPVTVTLSSGLKRVLVPGRIDKKTGEKMPVSAAQILNTPVQGEAAVGLKWALIECGKRGLAPYLSAVVHDELVATVPTAEAADFAAELERAMLAGMANVFDIPAKVEVGVDAAWKK